MAIGREQFLSELGAAFPEAIVAIDEYSEGLIHCEVAAFRRTTEEALNAGQEWQAEQHFRFVERMLSSADPELDNALRVSYLIDLALGKHTPEWYRVVKERMPKILHDQMVLASDYWK
jgi:hypothetical protein